MRFRQLFSHIFIKNWNIMKFSNRKTYECLTEIFKLKIFFSFY